MVDELAREIRRALEAGARWDGSPDRMWSAVGRQLGRRSTQGNTGIPSAAAGEEDALTNRQGAKGRWTMGARSFDRRGAIAVVLVLILSVATFIMGSLDDEGHRDPRTPALWVVPDATDPLQGTPYSFESLHEASTLQGGETGGLMHVTEPPDFVEWLAENDAEIMSLVFHIDVLDEVPQDEVRKQYERGMQIVLIGGGIGILTEWLGAYPTMDDETPEEALGAFLQHDAYSPDWPIARVVRAGGCAGMSESTLFYGGDEGWRSEDYIVWRVSNGCTSQRQELLRAL